MDTSNQASNERRYDRVRRGTLQPDQDDRTGIPQEVNSVSPVNILTTTKTGKPRKRILWTDEMNMNIMRCYYLSTRLETRKAGYRDEFYQLFINIYPQLAESVTPQRLADQKRFIISSHKVTQLIIERIKKEVANKIHPMNTNNTIRGQEEVDQTQVMSVNTPPTINLSHEQQELEYQRDDVNQNCQIKQKIYESLQENLIKWKDIEASKRSPLPKLIIKNNTQEVIHIMNNNVIKELCKEVNSLQDFHTLIYSAASTILQLNNQAFNTISNRIRLNDKPKWQIRIDERIKAIRQDLGRLTQYKSGNRSRRLLAHINRLIRCSTETIQEITDRLQQKLSVYSARLRRYNESYKRKMDNRNFVNGEKLFYRKLTEKSADIIPPKKEEITDFWKGIWSIPSQHEKDSAWITKEEKRYRNIIQQNDVSITYEELIETIKHLQSWKCPGIDHLSNYWYKTFTSTHKKLTELINELLLNPERCPDFFTQGITFIKPKNENTQNPANYRPITCLPTIYKIITSLICSKIYKHLMDNNILTNEQKGCRKWSRGCKEQLIIDTVIMQQAYKEQRNLHTSYIDYKKAFDMVPHSWLIHILKIYKVHPAFRNFLENVIKTWRTHILLRTKTEKIETIEIQIKRGIFQGDALSALWFCMCINPLSNLLNDTSYGFKIKHNKIVQHRVNHLLYMDDIKLYASTQTELNQLLNITSQVSADIKMEFGIDKCKTQHVERGKWISTEQTTTLNDEALESMKKDDTYKYLGIKQGTRIDHTNIKGELKNHFIKRLKSVVKTKLNSKNLFKAINTYVLPILTYSFGVIKWTSTDIQNLEIVMRKILTQSRKHHPKSSKERLTLPRHLGGRGLMDIEALHDNQKMKLREYFHANQNRLHKSIVLADKGYTPLNLSSNEAFITASLEDKITTWTQKEIHGRHPTIMQDINIDKRNSYTWLKRGELQPETEGFNIAIQDQIIATKNHLKYVIRDSKVIDDRCRKCHLSTENIDHITSGCQIQVGTHYMDRHNIVAKIIHQQILCDKFDDNNGQPYYQYQPVTIVENENFKLYWDITIQTDRTTNNNRPDLTLIDKKQKTTYLIEISVPGDNNLHRKFIEKINKYEALAIEIRRIWKQRSVVIIPFIISVTGILHKTFIPNLAKLNIPEIIHHKIQKAVILKTCNIVRAFLNVDEDE